MRKARYLLLAALGVAVLFALGGQDDVAERQKQAPAPGPIRAEGTAVDGGAYAKPLGAAVVSGVAREDDAYRRVLTETFTSVTPENGMKWSVVQPRRERFDFEDADAVVGFAQRTGKRVRGHPLLWDHQLPKWLEEGDWSRRELREILRRHIERLMGRYRGKVAEWDVVNEPLSEEGGLERNIWHRKLGPEYVEFAFGVARRADPDARLFLNEIAAEHEGPKARGLFRLLRHLKKRDVPIDGVGFQNHATGERAASRARLRELMGRARRLGLDVAITEMEVAEADDDQAASAYGDAARVCARARNCTGLTLWGVTDRWSWLGADAGALPWDSEGEPKPSRDALLEPLSR